MKKLILSSLLLGGLALGVSAHAMPWGYATSGSEEVAADPGATEGEGFQHHDDHGRGDFHRPPPEHGHFNGPHGEFRPHPGFRAGWHYGFGRPRPRWALGFAFAPFIWIGTAQPGYWQCTAFSPSARGGVSDVGPDQDQAAYDALYSCGGANYEAAGCYIPDGYCRPR